MTESTIQSAVDYLLRAAPGSQIIVFGSQARGDARADSDVDFLVIEPAVENRFEEMNRLARLLGERLVPADVVVMSSEMFEQWRAVPNSLAWRASQEGKLYERLA